MSSACTIHTRATGEPTTDPTTGAVTAAVGTVLYSGPCRVRPTGTQARVTEGGAAELSTFDYLISVPFAEADVAEGHRVTITATPDASLVGVEVEVQKVDRGEHITARRLLCNEVA